MKNYITTIIKGRPHLNGISARLDSTLERLALNTKAKTEDLIKQMMNVIQTKKEIIEVARLYDEIMNELSYEEAEVIESKMNGDA